MAETLAFGGHTARLQVHLRGAARDTGDPHSSEAPATGSWPSEVSRPYEDRTVDVAMLSPSRRRALPRREAHCAGKDGFAARRRWEDGTGVRRDSARLPPPTSFCSAGGRVSGVPETRLLSVKLNPMRWGQTPSCNGRRARRPRGGLWAPSQREQHPD